MVDLLVNPLQPIVQNFCISLRRKLTAKLLHFTKLFKVLTLFDFLILVMVGGLEPFLEKNFTWGPPKAPKKFNNPYFQILKKWLFSCESSSRGTNVRSSVRPFVCSSRSSVRPSVRLFVRQDTLTLTAY